MSDILLSAAVRDNLLTVSRTTQLLNRTTNRLSTMREVNSATDDAVRFFQSKGLNDRADDLKDRKTQMVQGVETLNTVTSTLASAESFLKTIKGIVSQARSASASERAGYTRNLKDNVQQINKLFNDASYQGLNLLNSKGSQLRVQFSDKANSDITVQGVDFTSVGTLYRNSLGVTVRNTRASLASKNLANPGANGSRVLDYLGFFDNSSRIKNPAAVSGIAGNISGRSLGTNWFTPAQMRKGAGLSVFLFSVSSDNADFIRRANTAIARLDATINAVKSQAAAIANASTVLATRISFTEDYMKTLQNGAGELVAADGLQESANSLTLTTRRELGMQGLSIAGQAEQSILQLFR